jgi:hypothetical protein
LSYSSSDETGGAIVYVHYGCALAWELRYDLSLAAERQKNIEDGSKIVQKYGEIYGQAILRQIEEDRAEELLIVNMWDQ